MDILKFRFLFRGIVRPHLEYATSVWNPASVKLQNLIEKVQRRASKRVHELKDLSYEERLKKLDMPTLAYRRLRGDMIDVFQNAYQQLWVRSICDDKSAEPWGAQ